MAFFYANHVPVDNVAKEKMWFASRSTLEKLLREMLDDEELDFEIAAFNQLIRILETYNEKSEPLREWKVQELLPALTKNVGGKDAKGKLRRINWANAKHTVWVLKNKEHWLHIELDKNTVDQIKKIFKANEWILNRLERG